MKKLLILLIFLLPSSQWIIRIHYHTLRLAYDHDLTIDQKYEIKIGQDYLFTQYIVKNYPEDATILINKKEIPKNSNVKNQAWVTYFVYPRKIKYE